MEAYKKMMVVGECLHVEMEEEDEDARVDETMKWTTTITERTTNEQETDNADIHATQVAPPVNEEEEDDEEEERDVVNGDEQNEQVTAPAEAFDPQRKIVLILNFRRQRFKNLRTKKNNKCKRRRRTARAKKQTKETTWRRNMRA